MARSTARPEQRHRSHWLSARRIAVIALSLCSTAAISQTSRERVQVSEDAVAIIGSHSTATTFLKRCAAALPTKADAIRHLFSELDRANSGIVTMARNKLYAIAEITEGTRGRQKLDTMLGDELQNAIQIEVAAMAYLASTCDGLLARGVEELKISERYPQERARILSYKVGYAWGPPGCEYQAVFPVRPEVHATEENSQSTQRASTPEGNIPMITAVCWPLPPGDAPGAISNIKSRSMRVLEESGVKDLRVKENATQKGYELDVTGEKNVDGTDTLVSRVFYLGNTSVLEVTITDSASVVPSLTASQFLDWIDRPGQKR